MVLENKPTYDAEEYFSDIQPAIASKMNEIKEKLPILQMKDPYVTCLTKELSALENQLKEQEKAKKIQLVRKKSEFKVRNEAFEPKFSDLKSCLSDLTAHIRPNWGVYLDLLANDESPLDETIRLLVADCARDPVFKNTLTLNHGIAVLILQLAINITIGSPFIIVGEIDEFVEASLNEYV